MLTYFYLVFQAEISGNELLANLGPFILKIFQGIREHVPGPSRRPKNFPRSFAAPKTFFWARHCPPRHKNLATALPSLTQMVFAVTLNDNRYHENQILANF